MVLQAAVKNGETVMFEDASDGKASNSAATGYADRVSEDAPWSADLFFRGLAEKTGEMIFRISLPDGHFDYVSPAVSEYLGVQPEELYRSPYLILERVRPDWQGFYEEQWENLLSGEIGGSIEFPVVDRGGTVRWLHQRNSIVRSESGFPVAVEGILVEITQRKKAEASLRQKSRIDRLSSAISSDLLNLGPDETDDGITNALQSVAEFAQADMICLFLLDEDKSIANLTFEWHAEGLEERIEKIQSISIEQFRWLLSRLSKRDYIRLTSPVNLPADAESESRLLHDLETESVLAVPLTSRGVLVGFLGMFSTTEPQEWGKDYLGLLNSVSDDVVSSLERKKAERSLEESERLYRRLIQTMGDGFATADIANTLTFVNDKLCEMLGYSADELIGRHVNNFIDPECHEIVETESSRRRKGKRTSYELVWRRKDGTSLTTIIAASAIIDSDRTYQGSFAVVTDITERKKSESAVLQSEAFHRTLIEKMNDGLIMTDENDIITFVNTRFCNIIGYGSEDIIGNSLSKFLDEKNMLISTEQLMERKRGKNDSYELVWLGNRGTHITTIVSPSPLIDGEGRFTGSFAVITNISGRKRAEESVRESEERLELAMNATNDGLWDFNPRTREINFLSPKWFSMLGYDQCELPHTYDTWVSMLHPRDRDRVEQEVWNTISSNGDGFTLEFRMRSKSGDYKWILDRGEIVERDDSGHAIRLIGTHVDITKQKKIELALRKTSDKLKSESKALEEKNITLRQILKHLEDRKEQFKQAVCTEVQRQTLPVLERLKPGLPDSQIAAIDEVIEQLRELFSSNCSELASRFSMLTPRETAVCELVRDGKSSKEISEQLHLSLFTVNKHREQARKKLRINNKGISLNAYLRS